MPSNQPEPVKRFWWCQSGMVDQEFGLRPIIFKTASPESFVPSDTYDRDIKALELEVYHGSQKLTEQAAEIESENEAYETAARLCDERSQELRDWNKMNLAKWASDQAQAFDEMAKEIRDCKN